MFSPQTDHFAGDGVAAPIGANNIEPEAVAEAVEAAEVALDASAVGGLRSIELIFRAGKRGERTKRELCIAAELTEIHNVGKSLFPRK